ncbi:MAG: class I tRNA ligase family protein, partial [Pseudomonadota bacterium]
MTRYNPKEAEPKWQQRWAEANAFRTADDPGKENYFVLEMFPYPSGRIHMGHVRNYAMGDVVARFKKAHGINIGVGPFAWMGTGLHRSVLCWHAKGI